MQFRLLVVAMAAAIVGLAVLQLPNMPVDTLPEFAPAHVEIQTEALGLSAVEVEQLITAPMEADLLNGVAWLEEIRSESVPGLSSIELVFEPGTDIFRARQLVAERLTQAHALPNVSTPPILMQPLSSSSRVMMVGLSSQDVSLIDLSVLARWQIKPRLMGIPGVANVAIWGQREQQLQVEVDPEVLRANDVTLNQVISTTGNAVWVSPLSFLEASTPGTGGFLDTANQRIGIQHVLPITTPEDLEQVSVEGTPPGGLRLGDVAQVVVDHQPLIGDAVVNDEPSLMLVVEKFPEASALEVTRGVEAALESLRPGLVGIDVDSTVFRPASFIETAMDDLGIGLLISLLLASLLLGAVLLSWRVAVITLVTLSLSLTAAALVLYVAGTGLNAVVFAGLAVALAVMVGDTVASVDGIRRRRRNAEADGAEQDGPGAIVDALHRVGTAMLYAVLITIVALAPVFVMAGVDGAFLQPLALSYGVGILVSMLVALTVTPALAVLLPGKAADTGEAPALRRIQRGYGRLLPRVMTRRVGIAATAVAAVIAVLAIAFTPALVRGEPVVPVLQDRTLLVQWDGLAGTSHPEMSRITAQVSTELRALPGVSNVGGHVGRAITSDQVVNVNSAELWVSIDPDADYDDTAAAVQEVVDGYPGLTRDVLSYPEQQIREVRTGAEQDFLVRVYGESLEVLREKAEEVRQILLDVDGVVNPQIDLQGEEPIAEIEVDLAAAQSAGVKPGDVRRAAAALLQGIEVGNLFEQQKVFGVVVQGVPATRNSLTSVRELLIDTPSGGHVRLGDVAEVRIVSNASVIRHDDTLRRIEIVADIDGRSTADVTADIERRLQAVDFPLEYHAEIPSNYEDRQQGETLLWGLALASAIGILVLLQAALGSWRLAALVFLTLPAALAGGVLAGFAGGGINSLVSLVGLAAVLTVAARNSVLLISRYQELRCDGEPFDQALVVRGSQERLGATVITVLASVLTLLPLVLFGGVLGGEILLPLIVIIAGGLVASALVTLFVLPALYLRFGAGVHHDPAPVGEMGPARTQVDGEAGQLVHSHSRMERGGRRMTVRGKRVAAGLLVAAGLVLPACTTPESEATGSAEEVAQVEEIEGTDLHRLTLTERAAERLGLETVEVAPGQPLEVPYSSVIYDAEGATWVFTSPEPLVYVRESITVERIDGDTAVLSAGPAAGTPVVTTGAAELLGAELGTGAGH
ncbi:MAG: efflux RND transporter permease subunit [Geodermatophilaceae bacterium]